MIAIKEADGVRRNLPALNGLRIVAALGVVCFHYGRLSIGFKELPLLAKNIVSNGTIALPFFYVLSGFVLAHAYSDRRQALTRKRDFYRARIARLFPAYIVSFILFLPIAVEKYLRAPAPNLHHGAQIFAVGGLLSLFALQSWTPLSQSWNGPAWSLSVEAFFYLIFPLILPRIMKMRPIALVSLLSLLWLSMISLSIAHEHNAIPPQVWNDYFMYHPLFWTPTFLLGIATYRLALPWSRISSAAATTASAMSLGLLMLLAGMLSPRVGGDFLVNGGAAPLIAVIVLSLSHPRAASSRLLGSTPLDFLGKASYVIYILQAPLWHMFRAGTDKLRHVSNQPTVQDWQFLLYLVVLVGSALLVQRLVERPVQRWLLQQSRLSTAAKGARPAGVVAA